MHLQSFETRERGWFAEPTPAPLSLETLEVAEQAIVQVLRRLRGEAARRAAQEAGAAEYDSWRAVRRG